MRRTLGVNLAIKIRVMPNLHGYLVLREAPLVFQIWVFDLVVVACWLAGQNNFLVLPRAVVAHEGPIAHGDRDAEYHDEEPIGVKSTPVDNWNNSLDEPWNAENESCKDGIGERTVTLGRQGRIFYGGDACQPHHYFKLLNF